MPKKSKAPVRTNEPARAAKAAANRRAKEAASRRWQTQSAASAGLAATVAATLFLVTLIVYWPATRHEFINFDDDVYVTGNPHVRQGLSIKTVGWAFRSTVGSNWHPLTWLSHLADVSVWGSDAKASGGHHLTNLLVHAFNSTLLFASLRWMTSRAWPSALVAALFAWHPLHVESVAWVAERKDVLSACFWFVTMAAYWHHARHAASRPCYAMLCGSFVLALLAKPMAVTLPFVLLLLDYWPLQRAGRPGGGPHRRWADLVREKWPLFLASAATCVVTFFAQRARGAVVSTEALPVAWRLANSLLAYVVYLKQTAWPVHLAVFYPYNDKQLPALAALAALGLLLGVSIAATGLRQRLPYLSVGWFWYLGTLVPVIGLVQVGGQAHADRYTYLPLVGIFIMIAWALAEIADRWRAARGPVVATATVALLACILLTRQQLSYWSDSVALFTHSIDVASDSPLALTNLGAALLSEGRCADAAERFRRAAAISPLPQARAGLAQSLLALGDVRSSIAIQRQEVERHPDDPKLANNLAWLLATCPEAEFRNPRQALDLALRANEQTGGTEPTVLDTLAVAYAAAGKFAEAVATADRAINAARAYPELVPAIRQRRSRFAKGQPYTEPLPVKPHKEKNARQAAARYNQAMTQPALSRFWKSWRRRHGIARGAGARNDVPCAG